MAEPWGRPGFRQLDYCGLAPSHLLETFEGFAAPSAALAPWTVAVNGDCEW